MGCQAPHVGDGVRLSGQRVVGLQGFQALQPKVQRKTEAQLLDRNPHPRLLRRHLGRLLHRPLLHGWAVEEQGEYQKQCDGRDDNSQKHF